MEAAGGGGSCSAHCRELVPSPAFVVVGNHRGTAGVVSIESPAGGAGKAAAMGTAVTIGRGAAGTGRGGGSPKSPAIGSSGPKVPYTR